ncbi:LGIC_ECD_bact domain containing protein [Candidatus Methylacidiphilaceae bacterium]
MKRSLLPLLFSVILFLSVGDSQAEFLQKGSLRPQEQPPASAQIVKIGFYPVSVHQLNIAANTYYIDTYVWLRWKGAIDPTKTIEFVNMVEDWNHEQSILYTKPKTEKDGTTYQIMRVEGLFVQPFSLADYPLDHQRLSIKVEDQIHGADKLAYEFDMENSGVGDLVKIPGWNLDGWRAESLTHNYETDFGDDAMARVYSMAKFSIQISRPENFFLWKLLLPLFMVIIAASSALWIRPHLLDARVALPAAALLSAIFLQKSYSDSLPDLGYLVLMDWIYLIAYPLIILTLIRVILAYFRVENADAAKILKIHNTDIKLMVFFLASFVLGVGLIVALH